MKKIKRYVYEFNVKEELEIYKKVGMKGSLYHNYCEWNRYISDKYGSSKYTEVTLKNFVHYLKREQNVIISEKETLCACIVPLLTVFLSIVYTSIFSIVNVINIYNNSINTLVNDEFMEHTGYSAKMIYMALEQNLHSGMWFYAFGTVFVILFLLIILLRGSMQIRYFNLKKDFYADYIMIIQEIIETQKMLKEVAI